MKLTNQNLCQHLHQTRIDSTNDWLCKGCGVINPPAAKKCTHLRLKESLSQGDKWCPDCDHREE